MYQVSLWEQESFFATKDFIVVGAGLAGLWTSLELKKKFPQAQITVLERGAIPMGASTRNAGFACFGSPTEMISDSEMHGEQQMWSLVQMRYQGIQKIRQYFGDDVIDFDNCGGYECLGSKEAVLVANKLGWLNKGMQQITGKSDCFKMEPEKLQNFGFSGFETMVGNSLEGGLHSGKLVQSLLKKVAAEGIQVMFNSPVLGWEQKLQTITVATAGFAIDCAQLVLTTNAFLSDLHIQKNMAPARGQVLVTEPIAGLMMRGTFHYDEGFYYFRNVANRIMLGGARNLAFEAERTTNMETSHDIQQELERFLGTHILPNQPFTISHRWSGVMAFTDTKLPTINQVEPNVWSLTACNGMGVALTPIMAEVLVQQITGGFKQPLFASSLHLSTTEN